VNEVVASGFSRKGTVRVAVIVNPISGAGGRPDAGRQRAKLAAALLETAHIEGDVFVTERPTQATDLTRAEMARGVDLVIAWGGDGTVNEVASALAFSDVPLAIVPTGSGNGLARELRIPLDVHQAFTAALSGRERRIDAGELDGHLFFNVAGVGLDANIARAFAANGRRRGFARYAQLTLREVLSYAPQEYSIATDAGTRRERVLMIAIANGCQYGNGAIIAPDACLDDGRLDVIVIRHRSAIVAIAQIPRIFAGKVTSVPGVFAETSTSVEISAGAPVIFHVDGEPHTGGYSIRARTHRHALIVKVPETH
jgi:diacylglycerol kinase (ATP)